MNSFSLLQGNSINGKKKYFRILLFAICNLYCVICNSQDHLGYINSSFAGVTGIDLNPACIVNNPREWDVSIIGLNVDAENNFLGLQKKAFDHTGGKFSGNYPAFNDNHFVQNYFTQRSGIKSISVFAAANISLPSFMFTRKKHKDAFAFTCRTRAYANVDGIDPSLASTMIKNGTNDSALFGQDLPSTKVSVQTMVWTEYGITYGKTVMQTSNERLNVAARAKLLQGLYAAYVYVGNINYKLIAADSVAIVSSQVNYGHSTNLEFNKNALRFGFGGKPSVGLDVGATYEFHALTNVRTKMASGSKTSPLQHEYRYKVGFSIQDLGWITYLKPSNAHDFTADLNNINTTSFATSGTTPLASADDTLKKKFGMTSSDTKFRMNLPTVMSLQGDYYAGKNIYVNSTMNYAFQFRNNENKIHEVTVFSITPRWDWKWVGTYFPVSYNKYSHLRAGVSLRLGPLIIGTSDILPLITKKNIYGLNFNFLLKVPHISFNKKDKNRKSKSKFEVNKEKNKKTRKQKEPKPDMPVKDAHKVRKHIFPRIHLFKKRKSNAAPVDEEHTIYFKI